MHIATAYKSLLGKAVDVFTRSSGGERVLETSGYWLEVSWENLKILSSYGLLTSWVGIPKTRFRHQEEVLLTES